MADWKDSITKTWAVETPDISRLSLLNIVLSLMSLPYKLLMTLRNELYDKGILKQKRLSCKVISVGNITVGGTGKTPMTIMLVNLLKAAGFRPAILSRGYGGKSASGINVVSDGQGLFMNPEEGGDEPVLMARSCSAVPVITGPERYLTGSFAISHFGTDILILDDGFQHRRLYRDIDMVLVDGQRPFGNGFMLPRGPLREPATAIKRADIIVKTGIKPPVAIGENNRYFGSLRNTIKVFNGHREPKEFIHGKSGKTHPLTDLEGKKVCAFAGIAVPDSFKKTLENIGIDVAAWMPFHDHHQYSQNDVNEIKRVALEATVDAIITTEKDGVKLASFKDFLTDIHLLKIDMTIWPSEDMLKVVILDKLKNL